MAGSVVAVHRSPVHGFSKEPQQRIEILVGHGVVGDAHAGATVKHRSRVAIDPTQPNLRQVHLMEGEILQRLREQGFAAEPGALGENVTTAGIVLRELPRATHLHIGSDVVLELTGLRNPCTQLDDHQQGLQGAMLGRRADGSLDRLAGVMSVVVTGGAVEPGADITVVLPPLPHEPMMQV